MAGTHYIPIALPSILGSLFLFAPLVAVAVKLQQSTTEARPDTRGLHSSTFWLNISAFRGIGGALRD